MAARGDAPHKCVIIAPWSIFWAGLALRVIYLTIAHTYRFREFQDHFQFGWEMGRIARALATGRGYADPFMGFSGPTAWCPPLYPLVLAGVFKLFGVYTSLADGIILTINSIFSAFTALLIYEIALRSFNKRVAVWSAWLWALYPAAMQYAVHWVWDMALTACLVCAVIIVALRCRGIGDPAPPPSSRRTLLWAIFGILWGAIALLNSSLLTLVPVFGVWMLYGERGNLVRGVGRASLAALLCAGCISPWIARNWKVFHAFIPLRTNLGCELYQSSLASNGSFPWGGAISIYADTPDMRRYRDLGEVAFCKERGEMAKAIFDAHSHRFERYTLNRIWFFWGAFRIPSRRASPRNSFGN